MATKKDILDILKHYNDDDKFVYSLWDENDFVVIASARIPEIHKIEKVSASDLREKVKTIYPTFIDDIIDELDEYDILDNDAVEEAIGAIWENKYAKK